MKDGVQVSHTDDQFVDLLAKWKKQQFLICAGTSGNDEGESTATQGLVQGHAYTIQSVAKVDGFKMLRCAYERGYLPRHIASLVVVAAVLRLRCACTAAL